MSYLQFGVPLSTDDMQRILDLIDHAEDTGFEDYEFLGRIKVLFSCAFSEAQARNAGFLAKSQLPSDNSELELSEDQKEAARFRYKFNLGFDTKNRCSCCKSFKRWEAGNSGNCTLLKFVIADPNKSVCPLFRDNQTLSE